MSTDANEELCPESFEPGAVWRLKPNLEDPGYERLVVVSFDGAQVRAVRDSGYTVTWPLYHFTDDYDYSPEETAARARSEKLAKARTHLRNAVQAWVDARIEKHLPAECACSGCAKIDASGAPGPDPENYRDAPAIHNAKHGWPYRFQIGAVWARRPDEVLRVICGESANGELSMQSVTRGPAEPVSRSQIEDLYVFREHYGWWALMPEEPEPETLPAQDQYGDEDWV